MYYYYIYYSCKESPFPYSETETKVHGSFSQRRLCQQGRRVQLDEEVIYNLNACMFNNSHCSALTMIKWFHDIHPHLLDIFVQGNITPFQMLNCTLNSIFADLSVMAIQEFQCIKINPALGSHLEFFLDCGQRLVSLSHFTLCKTTQLPLKNRVFYHGRREMSQRLVEASLVHVVVFLY